MYILRKSQIVNDYLKMQSPHRNTAFSQFNFFFAKNNKKKKENKERKTTKRRDAKQLAIILLTFLHAKKSHIKVKSQG